MPYVNIPESGLGGVVSKQIGKLQGDVVGKVLNQTSKMATQLQEKGCANPREINRLRNKLNSLQNAMNGVNGKLAKFKSLPSKLKAPIGGFKAALAIILALPIPQAVPPGIGLPINITTKYADVMHLLKEFIKQADELVKSIETALDTPANSLKSIDRALKKAELNVRTCEMKHSLDDSIAKGLTDQDELIRLGLAKLGTNTETGEEELDYIFSSLGPRILSDVNDGNFRGNYTDEVILNSLSSSPFYNVGDRVTYKGNEFECVIAHRANVNDLPGSSSDKWRNMAENADDLIASDLEGTLLQISNSNLNDEVKNNLSDFLSTVKNTTSTAGSDEVLDTQFIAPNGEVYDLEVLNDPTSPKIAPRRFAVAKDQQGVVVFRGPKSFSSSTTVLVDTLKLSIINQLS